MSNEEVSRLANNIVLAPGIELDTCQDRDQLICRVLRSAIDTFH